MSPTQCMERDHPGCLKTEVSRTPGRQTQRAGDGAKEHLRPYSDPQTHAHLSMQNPRVLVTAQEALRKRLGCPSS